MDLAPGEIYWAQAGPARHPIIVVSRISLNRGDYVVAVPVTSARIDERRNLPTNVLFEAGEAGLSRECVATAQQVSAVEIVDIDVEDGRIGQIDDERMRDLVRAIGYVMEADCEPE